MFQTTLNKKFKRIIHNEIKKCYITSRRLLFNILMLNYLSHKLLSPTKKYGGVKSLSCGPSLNFETQIRTLGKYNLSYLKKNISLKIR